MEVAEKLHSFFLMENPSDLDENDGSTVPPVLLAQALQILHRRVGLRRAAFVICPRLDDGQATLGIDLKELPEVARQEVVGHLIVIPLPL